MNLLKCLVVLMISHIAACYGGEKLNADIEKGGASKSVAMNNFAGASAPAYNLLYVDPNAPSAPPYVDPNVVTAEFVTNYNSINEGESGNSTPVVQGFLYQQMSDDGVPPTFVPSTSTPQTPAALSLLTGCPQSTANCLGSVYRFIYGGIAYGCNASYRCVGGSCYCIYQRIANACECLNDNFSPKRNPRLYLIAFSLAMVAGGSYMIWDAQANHEMTNETYDSTCVEGALTFDANGRDYYHHRHPCQTTRCIGSGCAEYDAGIAFVVIGSVVFVGTMCSYVGIDCARANAGRQGGGLQIRHR